MIQLGCKFEREGFRLKYMYIYIALSPRENLKRRPVVRFLGKLTGNSVRKAVIDQDIHRTEPIRYFHFIVRPSRLRSNPRIARSFKIVFGGVTRERWNITEDEEGGRFIVVDRDKCTRDCRESTRNTEQG